MKFKMNTLEKKWVLYDVGNSAFTLLVSTNMPIYFNYLAQTAGISDVNYLAYWDRFWEPPPTPKDGRKKSF